tara:strand:- start:181098 stop:182570 length:1473 start_codon:yes stop_codon:yes gene_type:complete
MHFPTRLNPHCSGVLLILSSFVVIAMGGQENSFAARPNIVLVMADDMGWGQTGYYNHPVLKTPNLDAMSENGLRFDRFYAGAPVCSPTRASVLTGRANDRTGVVQHGYALRRQETTIAQILSDAGYVTGHFGKWHLNGLRGPGVPILESDDHHPGHFGFDHWLSVTNFFDRDPILSRQGEFVEFEGDSSEIAVDEAMKFVSDQVSADKPFFTVIWYGTPHNPFKATAEDMQPFTDLDEDSRNHYGELVAMDRSIGTLRSRLRELGVADNTLFWFCSDNGGLGNITPDTVGGLRGNKGSVFEGGLRVPGIIEWPSRIQHARIVDHPASVLDILPTVLEILNIDYPIADRPLDGISLVPVIEGTATERQKPIPFRYMNALAIVDNDYKLLRSKSSRGEFELYHLSNDPTESTDLSKEKPGIARRLKKQLLAWNDSVEASIQGKDYPEGRVDPSEPESKFWMEVKEYEPYFDEWKNRWEYASRLAPKPKRAKK